MFLSKLCVYPALLAVKNLLYASCASMVNNDPSTPLREQQSNNHFIILFHLFIIYNILIMY